MIGKQTNRVPFYHHIAATADIGARRITYRMLVYQRVTRKYGIPELMAAVIHLEVEIRIWIMRQSLPQFVERQVFAALIYIHLLQAQHIGISLLKKLNHSVLRRFASHTHSVRVVRHDAQSMADRCGLLSVQKTVRHKQKTCTYQTDERTHKQYLEKLAQGDVIISATALQAE